MSDRIGAPLHVQIRAFPDGTRDFQFVFPETEEATGRALPFLFTERAPWLLEQIEKVQPATARQVFLAQLLSCCLIYRGNRRHLIVEPWSEDEIDGTVLKTGPQTLLRQNFSRDQADEFRLVTSGELPPTGTLAEVFWDAHVTTPRLPNVFEDPSMGEMALALLSLFNLNSQARNELPTSQIRSALSEMWSKSFSSLTLKTPKRERRRVFNKLMSATIRFASQFNGQIARIYVLDIIRNGECGAVDINDREDALIELRYGGCRALEDVNVALLYCCDGIYADLTNDYARSLAIGTAAEVCECEQTLNSYFSLLRSFRKRRRLARSAERRERRQSSQDFLPAPRVQAKDQKDSKAQNPAEQNSELPKEIFALLMEQLKDRDARKLKALVDAEWDRAAAAESLGLTVVHQTIKPNMRRVIRRSKFNNHGNGD